VKVIFLCFPEKKAPHLHTGFVQSAFPNWLKFSRHGAAASELLGIKLVQGPALGNLIFK
jgi:hypothetical protein